jgi:aldehyde dehydrogenase (NAD+)
MIESTLIALRQFFETGATASHDFRISQLKKLKLAVIKHEPEIHNALYNDLKKSPEESYATETGLLLAEINWAMKKLKSWMKPHRVSTNLMNLPSSSKVYHDPLGVILIIAPWNYPFQLSLIPLVGVIAGGNCAVLKPSELAPATAEIIEHIISATFPPEYIYPVLGKGHEIIPELMQGFRFDHVFYTGGVAVGKIIYQLAAPQLVPVSLELGGKSPAIIEGDADIRIAARRIGLGKFANTGQTCIAPDYVLVHRRIKDRFLESLKTAITHFFGGNPATSKNYGKIINERRFDQLLTYLTQGRIVFGGDHDRANLFISPTIMEDVPLNSTLMREEIFGPILPVIGFDSTEEAIDIVRMNPDPLALYIFTRDPVKEKLWIGSVSFGGGCVNNADWHFTNPHLPFGGIRNSGMGQYHGKYSFDTFTHPKSVMKTPGWIDPGIKYPPFQGKLKWFKRLVR